MVEILSGVINKRRAKTASAGATEENEERTDLLQVRPRARIHRSMIIHTCASPDPPPRRVGVLADLCTRKYLYVFACLSFGACASAFAGQSTDVKGSHGLTSCYY